MSVGKPNPDPHRSTGSFQNLNSSASQKPTERLGDALLLPQYKVQGRGKLSHRNFQTSVFRPQITHQKLDAKGIGFYTNQKVFVFSAALAAFEFSQVIYGLGRN
jgi:hypothetical protein